MTDDTEKNAIEPEINFEDLALDDKLSFLFQAVCEMRRDLDRTRADLGEVRQQVTEHATDKIGVRVFEERLGDMTGRIDGHLEATERLASAANDVAVDLHRQGRRHGLFEAKLPDELEKVAKAARKRLKD